MKYLGAPFAGDDNERPYPDIAIKFREITDGLSKTLLASETVQGQSGDARALTWWGWGAAFETYDPPNTNAVDMIQGLAHDCQAGSIRILRVRSQGASGIMRAAARSRHSGGVNAAMLRRLGAFRRR